VNQQSPVIQIDELSKVYRVTEREAGLAAAMRSLVKRKTRDVRAVDEISFSVNEGEIVGFLGPNGAGKTTLLRLISGVLKPSRGVIRINGDDLAALKPTSRAKLVSVVPQNPQLPLSFKVLDLVLMGRNPHLGLLQWEGRRDMEISRWAMEMTDVWYLADRRISTLSGGERQRALVAMALVQEAPLLLLDEPTSSLDLAHQTEIMDLVRDVQQKRGGAVVVAMHDLTLAAQYCDRLAMLAEGRRYSDGPPGEVLTTENISTVYGASVVVLSHPQGGTPVVLPISNGHAIINGKVGESGG
jgi:iron complex transport system ATP-binding protein